MRQLSDEEVHEEMRFIDMEPAWPLWPVMPVKHIHRHEKGYPEDEEVGVILANEADGKRTVYFKNLGELKTGPLGSQLEGVKSKTYASTEEFVRAGWIGD